MGAIIIEQGNGFPSVGDYVSSSDQLYQVTGELGRIHTDDIRGNYCYCEVEECDWDECPEADEFPALVQLWEPA